MNMLLAALGYAVEWVDRHPYVFVVGAAVLCLGMMIASLCSDARSSDPELSAVRRRQEELRNLKRMQDDANREP